MSQTRELGRVRRHRRLRKRIIGMPDRPRLCVFRSHRQLYAQLVDDTAGKTLLGWSTKDERLGKPRSTGTIEVAKTLGGLIAADTKQRGIHRIVFDRGGYLYHGCVKALADAARAGGLEV